MDEMKPPVGFGVRESEPQEEHPGSTSRGMYYYIYLFLFCFMFLLVSQYIFLI